MPHTTKSTEGMTPIHVRGKNKRPTNREREAAAAAGKGKRRPGRPLKKRPAPTDDDDAPSQPSRVSTPSPSKQPAKKKHRRPRRSQLELLPQELIERIFLLSENLSLALASPHLTSRLSSEYIFDNLSRQAFPAVYFKNKNYSCVNVDLQNAVVKQPWLTVDRLAMLKCTWRRFSLQIRWPDLLLPTRLLVRPFTDEKIDLLEQLLVIGGHVDWISTTTGEYATECLEHALVEENTRLISCLIRPRIGVPYTQDLWDYVAKPNWEKDPAREKVQERMDRIELLTRLEQDVQLAELEAEANAWFELEANGCVEWDSEQESDFVSGNEEGGEDKDKGVVSGSESDDNDDEYKNEEA